LIAYEAETAKELKKAFQDSVNTYIRGHTRLRSALSPCDRTIRGRRNTVGIRSWGDRADRRINRVELESGFTDMMTKLRMPTVYRNCSILMLPLYCENTGARRPRLDKITDCCLPRHHHHPATERIRFPTTRPYRVTIRRQGDGRAKTGANMKYVRKESNQRLTLTTSTVVGYSGTPSESAAFSLTLGDIDPRR